MTIIAAATAAPNGFEITLRDRSVELVADADTFVHEKSMTTFYRTNNARRTIDCWSVPLASVRTDEILMIKAAEARATIDLSDDRATDTNVVQLQTA
jgi:hypothetical protein